MSLSSKRSTSTTLLALPSSLDESACSNSGLHSSLLLPGAIDVGSAYKAKCMPRTRRSS